MGISRTVEVVAFCGLLFMAGVPVWANLAPEVEGRIHPVVGQVEIVEVYDVRDGWTYFSMSAEKFRGDCKWRDTIFYLGSRAAGGGVFAPFEHLEKPQDRDKVDLFWAKNRTRLTESQLRESSFADVYHQCAGWWRIWETKTHYHN